MTSTRLVKAAATASATLVLTGVVLDRAVVQPRESRARAELAELNAEDARQAQRAAFAAVDSAHPFLRGLADQLDWSHLGELKHVLPGTREAARDAFLANLRRIGAWSAEVESLDWSERSSDGVRYVAGKARVRFEPSGRGWLATVRSLQHVAQRVSVDCVDVSDLSDPSSSVTVEVTLYAQPPDPMQMIAQRPGGSEPGARGFRWADVFRRAPKESAESTETPNASTAPVLASIRRGACYGGCPVYSMVVHEDGIVDYEGRELVKVEGKHRFRIGLDRVRALSAAFDAAGFGAFDSSYTDRARMCFETVELTYRGKSVTHDHGTEDAPASLRYLEDALDRIVGTDDWIGTPKEREAFRGLR